MDTDQHPAARLRARLDGLAGFSEKRMMGGHCFFLNGNMVGCAGRNKAGEGWFMLRVGKNNSARAEALHGGKPVMKGGQRMGGMYLVDQEQSDAIIGAWVALAVGNALCLPVK